MAPFPFARERASKLTPVAQLLQQEPQLGLLLYLQLQGLQFLQLELPEFLQQPERSVLYLSC